VPGIKWLAAIAAVAALVATVASSAGAAEDLPHGADASAAAEAYYRLGQTDEDAGDFAKARADDVACAGADPGGPWAWRASQRIAWLDARSEGGFAPLARLEQVRRSPTLSSDPQAIEALARDADAFPPGRVRVEARLLVAEAWLGRMHRSADAQVELRKVTDDPATDPLTLRLAERELVDLLAREGRPDDAAQEATAHADRLDPHIVKQTARLARRRWVRYAAIAELAAFSALAAAALLRSRRGAEASRALRTVAPIAIAFALYLGVGGGLLASRYESGNATPFLLLGAVALPLVLLARAWAAVGSRGARARWGRSLVCATSVVAAAFVLLDAVNPAYLDGFGL